MGPKLKAALWILTLLTAVYASQQYRIAQQARASAQTQHTTVSTVPHPSFKVTQIDGQLMRINETTGETYYWSADGGGWVKINETQLVSAVSETERTARKAAIQTWYSAIPPALKENLPYETWENTWMETPSWQIQESFNNWKQKQAEEQRRTEQESLKALIQAWYQQLTPQEQTINPYDQYEAKLLTTTDVPARQGVIRAWYDLMDNGYKQKVPLKRFEAIEIQEPLANLQAGLAKQQKAAAVSSTRRTTKLCPKCGNRFAAENQKETCPFDGARLQVVSAEIPSESGSTTVSSRRAP